ncbi:MAG: hypothetical protein M3Z85_18395 [Acidobacteriota bacterium]|nr:hypothetical protein [Acidobacteriota bacterium]
MRFPILFLLPALAGAAMFPDTLGTAHRTASHPISVTDQALWAEYGLQDSEQASYEVEPKSNAPYTVAGYRLQDPTGALAAYQWQVGGKSPAQTVARVGTYLLVFERHRPTSAELGALKGSLPRLEDGPLPTLPNYLPGYGLSPVSERYVLGPVSLAKFYPGISPSEAGFHFGAEAQVADFISPAGTLKLAVFSYPTEGIARDRAAAFEKVSRAMAKRAGPLVAVVLAPTDLNEAEKLLSQIRYQASVTQGHRFSPPPENAGVFFINIFKLIGILLVFCILSGLAVGGWRIILRRGGLNGDGDQMISLGLRNR